MKTRAIIIKKQPVNEYDELITCYTQESGKITAIAKSILKNSSVQAMHLDNFNLVDFELVTGKGNPIITGAQSERVFGNIKNDLIRTGIAGFFTEAVNKLVPEFERDDSLWEFLVDTLVKIDTSVRGDNALTFLRQRQFYMLGILGYAPIADAIVSPGNLYSNTRTGIDRTFEYASASQFKSLDFIYSVVK